MTHNSVQSHTKTVLLRGKRCPQKKKLYILLQIRCRRRHEQLLVEGKLMRSIFASHVYAMYRKSYTQYNVIYHHNFLVGFRLNFQLTIVSKRMSSLSVLKWLVMAGQVLKYQDESKTAVVSPMPPSSTFPLFLSGLSPLLPASTFPT